MIDHIAVIGAGQMGAGIAQAAAQAGYRVTVRDVTDEALARGRRTIEGSLAKFVEKGVVSADDRDAALARLAFTTRLEDCAPADLAIEAVVEDLAVKNELFRALDAACPPHTVLASNTSSLTIAAMAVATGRPDRVVGMHFFNPVPLMGLVELVKAVTTSDATVAAVTEVARRMGKTPIVAPDRGGFLVNYLLVPYMIDAINALEAKVGTIADIDAGMKLGCGHPMGPFTLLDFVGLDTVAKIADILYDEYREKRYAAPPLLRRMVLAGWYGRKSGLGFYDWSGKVPVPNPALG
jgi:3-hydroxybutyryl-CoA dehydrogenase